MLHRPQLRRKGGKRKSPRPFGPWLLLLLVALLLPACESGGEEVSEADVEAIESSLGRYLPLMAEAYSTGNIEVLRDVAAEKEIATIHKLVSEKMAEGLFLDPTLIDFTIEEVNQWNNSNAFVTTVENWDLKVVAAGSDKVLSERAQRNRVKYQLKKKDGGWRVLYRSIEATF